MSHHRSALALLLVAMLATPHALAPVVTNAQSSGTVFIVDDSRDTDAEDDLSKYCTPNNDNDCTLRQAIRKANVASGTVTINFDFASIDDIKDGNGTGHYIFKPASAYPPLTHGSTTIDGANNSNPLVVIDGSAVAASSAVGFTLSSSNNTIKYMTVINFNGDGSEASGIGVMITQQSGTTVTGNKILSSYFGVRPGFSVANGNSRAGIQIDGSSANAIGDTNGGNVISGNGGDGIIVRNANNNTIQNNLIGPSRTTLSAIVPLGNTSNGIQIAGGSGNTIGGTVNGTQNTISSNKKSGILITSVSSNGNIIQGNYIGTDQVGNKGNGFGNGKDGISIVNSAKNNTVEGAANARSILAANQGYGVLIRDNGTTGNKVYSSFVGVTTSGAVAGNALGGVRIEDGANANIIGDANKGNIISGNTNYGISLGTISSAFSVISNTIEANLVGLSFQGTAPISNSSGGIFLGDGAKQTRIGSNATGDGNIIAGNNGPGIQVQGARSTGTIIAGNTIGLRRETTNSAFNTVQPNVGGGIIVTNAPSTRVGGTTANDGNTVAGNTVVGVRFTGSTATGGSITNNVIGTLATSLGTNLGNAGNGVQIDAGAAQTNVLTNTIFFNTGNGVDVQGNTQRIRIMDNRISANGGKGINLAGTTLNGGSATNPNHDIDPPFNIRVNQARQLTGRVTVGNTPSACTTCTVQIFGVDPGLLDSEGRNPINAKPTIDAKGYFTTTLSAIPSQLALTATDSNGNTSEFASFTAIYSLTLSAAAPQSAAPGSTVTYQHTLTNNGTIDLTDITLSATSSLNWTKAVSPTGTISLRSGEARQVTVKLTLPTGTAANVRAGLIDETTLTAKSTSAVTATASTIDRTTVLAQFVAVVNPPTSNGVAKPQTEVLYSHSITNNGNITGTLALNTSTDIGWTSSVSPTQVTIPPGQSRSVVVKVVVPSGAQEKTVARTILQLKTTDQQVQQTYYVTDTTTVGLQVLASLQPKAAADQTSPAGSVVTFQHTVTNLSNGTTTFGLTAASQLGSTIRFISTNGVQIKSDGTFTLGNTSSNNTLTFNVEVTVNPKSITGEVDTITINLRRQDNAIIDSAQDRILITRGEITPKAYLPLIQQSS